MAKISHPNIVKFIGYSPVNFHQEDRPVIITELLSNGTLADIIQNERKSMAPNMWDSTRKLINIYGIAAAMNFLHSHGIIHRDLKPANILMDESLNPKVADFGLSKKIDSQDSLNIQSTLGLKGTPIYMAPEVFSDYKYTPACDVYAFSMIVYEIMCNDVPFKDCGFYQICAQVTSGTRPQFPESIPMPYQIFIECCWEQNPDDRPTFDQIVQVLKTNKGFITDLVDENEFLNYIDYVEECQISFDKTKKIKSLDAIEQPKKVKIIETDEVVNDTNGIMTSKNDEIETKTRSRSSTTKPNAPPLIDDIASDKQKFKINDKIAMFNKIKVMGTPVKSVENIKSPASISTANNNSTNEPKNISSKISEKKALFEGKSNDSIGNDTKIETKFAVKNISSNNRQEVHSHIVSSNQLDLDAKRTPPLMAQNEGKKDTNTSNRNSANINKYKESLNQKIAMFNKSSNSSANEIPPFQKSTVNHNNK